jgi:hypothetical protein
VVLDPARILCRNLGRNSETDKKLSNKRMTLEDLFCVCAALFGKSEGGGFFGDEPTTFLGWYATEEDISKEIMEIHDAIVNGITTYTLQYSVRTKKRLLGIKIELE